MLGCHNWQVNERKSRETEGWPKRSLLFKMNIQNELDFDGFREQTPSNASQDPESLPFS
jgi:hypothetical protein